MTQAPDTGCSARDPGRDRVIKPAGINADWRYFIGVLFAVLMLVTYVSVTGLGLVELFYR